MKGGERLEEELRLVAKQTRLLWNILDLGVILCDFFTETFALHVCLVGS